MQRIAVDMDGVLSDTVEQFISWEEKETGIRKTVEDVTGIPEWKAFPNSEKYLHTANFFRTAGVIKDSQEIMAKLNEKYDVYIVSAATEFPISLTEKQSWLNEYFPFITWQQMVFCGSKEIVRADIMIDDHFKNLDFFTGQTSLLYTQPHNALSDNGRHKRVNNWQEIAARLL
ncbi:MAG: 5' nucleotidase, NT5C type [Chitinophagaceae bacterium]